VVRRHAGMTTAVPHYLDKLVDELAKGWPSEKVLRN
jgi:hypothetical protein